MAQAPLDEGASGKAPQVAARLSRQQVEDLDELAARRGVHRSVLIRQAVADLLEREGVA